MQSYWFSLILLLLLNSLGPSYCCAQAKPVARNVLDLQVSEANKLDRAIQILHDEGGTLILSDVLNLDSTRWSAPPEATLNPGYARGNFWVATTLRNSSTLNAWYLLPDYPHVDIEAFLIQPDGTVTKAEASHQVQRYEIRRLAIEPGKEVRLYIKVSSRLTASLQFKILSHEMLDVRLNQETQLVGAIAGVLVAMIIYNFFLAITLKDRDHFYYLLFALVNGHLNLMSTNYPEGIFNWFGLDWWPLTNFYRPLAPLTTFLFARSFLQTKEQHPKLDRFLLVYISGLVACIVLSPFFSSVDLNIFEDAYFLIGIGLLLAAGIISIRHGFQPAHYYIVGLIFFVLGMAIYIMRSEGLLPTNAVTLHAHLAFQAVETLLMSLALSAKIKDLHIGKAKAEVTAQIKSRMLRVITHDIANPLSIVKGSTYLLKSEKANPKRLESINRAVDVIQEIIQFVHKTENLASTSKIATTNVQLAEVFEDLKFNFTDMAQSKDISLEFILTDPDLHVVAERTSFTYEVMSNFISNAIKFSHVGGQVTVQAKLRRGNSVALEITDRGIGMSREMLAGVFDPTTNPSRPGTSGERGARFGILIAKAYIENYGKGLHIESTSIDEDRENCGTKVTIEMTSTYSPLAKP